MLQRIAARQLDMYAVGTVEFHGVDRYPGRGYVNYNAPRAHVTIGGMQYTTSSTGGVRMNSAPASIFCARRRHSVSMSAASGLNAAATCSRVGSPIG